MARLLSWPRDVSVVAWQPLSGPRTMGAAATESVTGFIQTTATAFGLHRWQLTVRAMRGRMARLHRGMVVAMHGGANAVRVPFCDPDGLSLAESGVDATPYEVRAGVPWDNGKSWEDTGANWTIGRPWVDITTGGDVGDTEIRLANADWGYDLTVGAWIGFVPAHFGLYIVTERIDDVGRYRIWPPLRKVLTTDDFATLDPVMVMRPEGEAAATAARGIGLAEGNTLTLVEVEDSDVRDYFAD